MSTTITGPGRLPIPTANTPSPAAGGPPVNPSELVPVATPSTLAPNTAKTEFTGKDLTPEAQGKLGNGPAKDTSYLLSAQLNTDSTLARLLQDPTGGKLLRKLGVEDGGALRDFAERLQAKLNGGKDFQLDKLLTADDQHFLASNLLTSTSAQAADSGTGAAAQDTAAAARLSQDASGAGAVPKFSDKNHPEFPTRDGYPEYKQGDSAWNRETMPGKDNHIGNKGCAISSVAMALSGITGQTITPADMNRYMKEIGGYSGASISKWEAMGKMCKPPVDVKRHHGENFTPDKVDKELAAGRPVVMGVDYKEGSGKNRHAGHDGKTDHWILITGKNPDGTYRANDPATGKTLTLHRTKDGHLEADQPAGNGAKYITTGEAATFSRGPKAGGAGSAQAPAAHPEGQSAGSAPTSGKGQPAPAATTGKPSAPHAAHTTGHSGTHGAHGTHRAAATEHASAKVSADEFKSVDPAEFRRGGTKSKAAIVVGTAEGNRTPEGGVRGSYNGHNDPANGKRNLGSFSVQGTKAREAHGDPARADEIELKELGNVTEDFEKAARAAGLDPHNALLLATYYDLRTQSPATAKAFLAELPRLAKEGVTVEHLVQARVRAFNNNGKTGGWHDTPEKVEPDAWRREEALVSALRAQGLAK